MAVWRNGLDTKITILQMSMQLKEVQYGPRALETNWINCIFQTHDLICGCNDPILHLMILINKKGNAPKPEPEIRNIKCLLTGETATGNTKEKDDLPFEDGELEQLFKEDDETDTKEKDGETSG